ncbi:hypothetical protein PIB30_066151 [Stylosanthes scabra]|uniref:F-box protein n=1 Tax=Stylosanthes scabra TaxID=79078 RepID=A0ABU6TN61_9FABA|nr:hypothetical protein [Stylosanthes scabra]
MKAHSDVVERCNLPVLPDDIVDKILGDREPPSNLSFGLRQPKLLPEPIWILAPATPVQEVVSFEMPYYISSLVIRGSCNGLVCLHQIHSNYICLWNPCIGLGSHWLRIRIDVSSLYYFGFGYDHVHDKYKFVTVHGRQALTRIPS